MLLFIFCLEKQELVFTIDASNTLLSETRSDSVEESVSKRLMDFTIG